MQDRNTILDQINTVVKEVVPDAKIYLFGSRVTGNTHEESDWDILVLTKDKPDKSLSNVIRKSLYRLSLRWNTFIHSIVISEDDWENNPTYYSLYSNIGTNRLQL